MSHRLSLAVLFAFGVFASARADSTVPKDGTALRAELIRLPASGQSPAAGHDRVAPADAAPFFFLLAA